MAKFYKSIFKGTKIGKTAYWGRNPMGVKEGSVLTMHITLLGQKIMLLNGYDKMTFNESISFVVPCKTQKEIDTYWKKLIRGGGKPVQCGWLVDSFGVSWQIVPKQLGEMLSASDKAKSGRAMQAMMGMQKLDLAKLQAAFNGA